MAPQADPAPLLLDGAMGTALIAAGLPVRDLPEDWLAARPEAIAAVHAAHAAAGARVVLTCTFNLASPRLAPQAGRPPAAALARTAVALARTAAPGARVAGGLGPTGLAGPGLPAPDPAALADRYRTAARALAEAGADLLWLESQWDAAEARIALAAARETGLPTWLTFALADRGGRLTAPDGTPAEALLAAAAAGGATIAGVNCVFAGPALTALAAWARGALPVPFAAKPSPGLPGAVVAPEDFAGALRPAVEAGLRIAGGCCGATADHLRAVGAVLGAAG